MITVAKDDLYSHYGPEIENKTILITGGTGSFGSAVTAVLLKLKPKRVIVFSRDEQKQFDLANRLDDKRLSFIIGDVRDKEVVDRAMEGVDYVFHAAALKQILTGEFFPLELIKTNVLGSNNVITSAIEHGVKRVVTLSTDKAVRPLSVMGMTKALMERTMISNARRADNKTILCATRYGNVLYTRGSVIPYFIERIKRGKSITVTDPNMTRFFMTINESLDLVLFALTSGKPGEIYVRKAPAATVADLAEAVKEIFSYEMPIENIGIRPGESTDEFLISGEERLRSRDLGNYYSISPEISRQDYPSSYFDIEQGKKADISEKGYGSTQTERLTKDQVKECLLSLPEVQAELASYKAGVPKFDNIINS